VSIVKVNFHVVIFVEDTTKVVSLRKTK
jgi:hypothetical protein